MANENCSLVFNLLLWFLLRSLLSWLVKLQSTTTNGLTGAGTCRPGISANSRTVPVPIPNLTDCTSPPVTNANTHGEELLSVGQREVWYLPGETTGSFGLERGLGDLQPTLLLKHSTSLGGDQAVVPTDTKIRWALSTDAHRAKTPGYKAATLALHTQQLCG